MTIALIFAGILMLPLGIYLYHIIMRLLGLFTDGRKQPWQKPLSALSAAAITLPCLNLFGLWALLVFYFTAITAMIDIILFFFKKAGHQPHTAFTAAYRSGIIPAAITAIIISYAYANMHHVIATGYTVATDKPIRKEGYRIAFLSDLHFGTTMGLGQLESYCERIGKERPFAVVLGGDIVDEATTLQQAKEAFQALAQISSECGTFYVYGNHDKGTYSKDCDFTPAQLSDTIKNCGIHILDDMTAKLNNEISLSGRKDRSGSMAGGTGRAGSGTLLEGIPDCFHILADHQPRGMEENAAAGFDLMLSGHTHAGQMWPVGLITELFDKFTVNYGRKAFGDMDLIVSSGIAGWGYPLRTGKHSEYVIIDIVRTPPA